MERPIPDDVRHFLADRRYAIIATIDPDGSPHQAVAWYLLEGDALVVNSAEGRRWPANLRRDGRISVVVEDGLRWVGLVGHVEVVDDQERAQADIAAMARRNEEPAEAEALIRDRFERQRRVSFRLHPSSIHAEFGEG